MITRTDSLSSIDVWKTRPELLQRLRERFHNEVLTFKRRKLRHEMRRQTFEEHRTDRAKVPGAECCYDAIRKPPREVEIDRRFGDSKNHKMVCGGIRRDALYSEDTRECARMKLADASNRRRIQRVLSPAIGRV